MYGYFFSKSSSNVFENKLLAILNSRLELLSGIYKIPKVGKKDDQSPQTLEDIIMSDYLKKFYEFEESFIEIGSIKKKKDDSLWWVEKPIGLIAFIIILHDHGYIKKTALIKYRINCRKNFEKRYNIKLGQSFERARVEKNNLEIYSNLISQVDRLKARVKKSSRVDLKNVEWPDNIKNMPSKGSGYFIFTKDQRELMKNDSTVRTNGKWNKNFQPICAKKWHNELTAEQRAKYCATDKTQEKNIAKKKYVMDNLDKVPHFNIISNVSNEDIFETQSHGTSLILKNMMVAGNIINNQEKLWNKMKSLKLSVDTLKTRIVRSITKGRPRSTKGRKRVVKRKKRGTRKKKRVVKYKANKGADFQSNTKSIKTKTKYDKER